MAQKKADFYGLAARLGVSPYVVRIMVNRGLSEAAMEQFLHGGLESLHSPHLLMGMEDAVALLRQTITSLRQESDSREKIAIASDFDCDGIFAAMVLSEGLKEWGVKPLIYTPDRVSEGYGLNDRIVDEARDAGVTLLITCDNGIAAAEPIRYAKDLGMRVIVTDHHEVPFDAMEDGRRRYILPEADAIVNPKQEGCPYPFKDICGATVAYKLMEALYAAMGADAATCRPLLPYVAIATVTDVMDLVDENRIIVKYGLSMLDECGTVGLRALMEANGIGSRKVSASHVGYVIGPCFNAAGRLDTVNMAFRLLTCEDGEKAARFAAELKELNEARKRMTEEGYEKARSLVDAGEWRDDNVLLVPLQDCHESLAGIIAGRLRERYHKPCFVLVEVEDGLKGSGRSIEAYHMFEELTACKDLLTRYGGHHMAAGLSMKKENLDELRRRLNEQARLTEEDLVPVVPIDIDLPIQCITKELINELQLLEPFGKGNPKPLFAERRFGMRNARFIGREANFLKMKVANEKGHEMEAVYFGDAQTFVARMKDEYGDKEVEKLLGGRPNQVGAALTYYPSLNEYNGNETLQIVVQNYRIAPKMPI